MAVDLKRFAETATCEPTQPLEPVAVESPWEPSGREDMNIVIVGHVDHGKSTIIGRLLADTNSLPEGKLEQIKERCRQTAKRFEYSFLLDALKDEQEQGITIDAARCHFKTAKRNYLIIDAPGHVEFLKNMVTGAARAEAALLVIDASEGVQENSKRHGYLLSMLGIKQIAVLINKMDLADYDQVRYERLVSEYGAFLASIGTRPAVFLPVSGRESDNIAGPSQAMPWYEGPSVLAVLDSFHSQPLPLDKPLRMPVQGIYRFTQGGDNRRIVAGTIETGSLKVGDRLVFYPSGKESRVRTIEAFNTDPQPEYAAAGEAIGVTLEEQIYIKRGEIACQAGEPAPRTTDRLTTTLFWLGKTPMTMGKSYLLKLGTAKVGVRLAEVGEVLDAATLRRSRKSHVDRHDVAECVLELDVPIAFDDADTVAQTSRFVIIDDYEISGGGIVQETLEHSRTEPRELAIEDPDARDPGVADLDTNDLGGRDSETRDGVVEDPDAGDSRVADFDPSNLGRDSDARDPGGEDSAIGYLGNHRDLARQSILNRHRGPVSREERIRALGQHGLVLWFTGLSGAGKSTISVALERALFERGRAVYRLDGDHLRQGLCSDLDFGEADREENIRRVAEVAALFENAGMIVLVSCISPLVRLREMARARIGERFLEIYVKAGLQTCIDRDPKGLYAKALRGEIPEFTGVSSPYEEPQAPDVLLDTELRTKQECVQHVLDEVEQRLGLWGRGR